MDRPRSHVIDSQGEDQLREIFHSEGWVVNKIASDYGIDFDIQIFEEGKATGEWFKVQLKSSENTQYSAKVTSCLKRSTRCMQRIFRLKCATQSF